MSLRSILVIGLALCLASSFSEAGSKKVKICKFNENKQEYKLKKVTGKKADKLINQGRAILPGEGGLDLKCRERRVAFSWYDSSRGGSEIVVTNLDGSNPFRMTDNYFNDYNPRTSRNGKKIVYSTSEYDGIINIVRSKINGDNKTRITFCENGCTNGGWNPTKGSKSILLSRADEPALPASGSGENLNIFELNLKTNVETPIDVEAGINHDYAAFFPDGTKIFYHQGAQFCTACLRLFTLEYPGLTNKTQITGENIFGCHLNDTGTQFACRRFQGGNGLIVVNVDGTNLQQIDSGSVDVQGWIPGTSTILYGMGDQVFAIESDGSNKRVFFDGF